MSRVSEVVGWYLIVLGSRDAPWLQQADPVAGAPRATIGSESCLRRDTCGR
jgi:hypothetical protein